MGIHAAVAGLALLLATLHVCATEQVALQQVIEPIQPVTPASAIQLAAELTALYSATPTRCVDDSPAYKCSGVMLRGTRQNLPVGQGAWEPYPRGRTLDTSFTFARTDIRISRLAWHYANGFIIAPPQELSVNCIFPIDAVSDDRLEQGCGPNKTYVYDYSLCETLLAGAVDMDRNSAAYRWTLDQLAQLWLDWDQRFASDMRRRCSYRLNDQYATQRFEIALAVAAKASQLTDKPNDMKVQTWNPGHDPRLPIRAFFYINDQGKPFAERDRDQFEQSTKIHLPILKLTIPDQNSGQLSFTPGE
ncbi:hypothetical protein ACX3YG_19505 [Pseudomonas wadenswilerensis]